MRPKILIFSGVNCFVDKQIINFDKLCSQGIFGIFGPTGSGKSTILDAITLALFGEVGRSKNKGDFVNSRCKAAYVEFIFTTSEEFKVIRKYKIRKNGSIDSEAQLYKNNIIVAEGIRDVDQFIKVATGLTMQDFSKCVALPQGEFAAFLKTKPAERISLVGKLFGLENYGDELTSKVNLRKEILLQNINHTDELLEKLGSNLKDEIENLNVQSQSLQVEIKNCNKEIEIISDNLIKQNKMLEEKNKIDKIIAEKKELEAMSAVMQEKKLALNCHEEILNQKENLLRYSNLNKQIVEDRKQLEILNQKLFMIKNELSAILERQKENVKRQETLKNADDVILELKSFQKSLSGIEKLESEILKIKETINENTRELEIFRGNKNAYIQQTHETVEELKSVDNKIEDLNKQLDLLKNLEFKKTLIDSKNVYYSVLKELQFNYEKLDKNISFQKEEIKRRNEINNSNQLKINSILNNIGFDSNFKEIEKSLENELDKIEHAKEYIKLIQTQIDNIVEKSKQEEIQINLSLSELKKIDETRDNLEKAKLSLKQRLKDLELERDNALLDKAENTVSSETILGEECPICGNIVTHVYPQKNVIISNINNSIVLVKKEVENIESEIVQNLVKRALLEKTINTYQDNKVNYQKSISELENSISRVLIAFVDLSDNAKDEFEKKYQFITWQLESLEKVKEKVLTLIKNNELIEQQVSECGVNIVKDEETKEIIYEYIQQIQNLIAENEFEKLADFGNAYTQIEFENSKVSEELEKYKNRKNELENKKHQIDIKATECDVLINSLEKQLLEQKNKLDENEKELIKIEEKEKELKLSFRSIEDRIKKTQSAKNDILDESKNISEQLSEKTILFEESNIMATALEQKVVSEEDELQYLKNIVVSLLQKSRKKNIEELFELLNSDKTELKSEIDEYEKNRLINSNMYENINYKEDEFIYDEKLEESLKINQQKLYQLQTSLGAIEEKIKMKENNLTERNSLVSKKEVLKNKYENYCELSSLFRGKELLAFAAEEYLQEICEIASKKLYYLIDGRYSLVYHEKDFYVIDNFDDGNLRATTTLSGGETFIVSLTLALSIAESIMRLANKKIDFFFLDEGFGTLDQELRENIVGALKKLKDSGITIGLISHMQELKNDINNRIEIKRVALPDGTLKSNLQFVQEL